MNLTITQIGGTIGDGVTPSPGVTLTVAVPGSIAGPAGPAGPPGSSGETFVFSQNVPAATWVITHGLGTFPSVVVVDSGNTVVEGDIFYASANQIILTFSGGFAGSAYLN